MKKLKKIFKNKVFYAMLLFMILFFPEAIMKDAEIDTKAVASAVGVDKTDEGVELSALVVVPNKSGSSESVKLASSKGANIAEAISNMSMSFGKKLGLAHCEAVVFGEEAMYENLADQMDFFIRASNMATNAMVINCSGEAKELLTAIASDNNELALSLKNIINFNEEYLFTSDVDIETFYKNYFSESNSSFIPIISVEDDDSGGGGSSGGSGGETGNSSEGGSSGGSGGGSSSGSGSKKKVVSEGKASVIKRGMKIREVSEEEISGYNWLSKKVKQGNISVDGITDENFTNATLDFEIEGKDASIKVKFDGDKPYCEVNVELVLNLDSVDSEGYNYRMQDSTKEYVTPEVEAKIREKVLGSINKVFEEMRANQTDTLFIARDFNRFHNKKWKNYLSSLEDENSYLDGIEIRTNVEMYGRL